MPWRELPGEEHDTVLPLKAGINAIASRLGAPSANDLSIVFGVWDEAVGEQLAVHAQPSAIRHDVLVVDVDDGRWATQLKWLAPQVTKQLNKALGRDSIARLDIKFKPGSRAQKP